MPPRSERIALVRITAPHDVPAPRPKMPAAPEAHPRDRVLELQRTAGNAAVGRLLARRPRGLMDDRASAGEYPQWYTDTRQALEAYRKSGKKGPITYDPSKRNKANYYGG